METSSLPSDDRTTMRWGGLASLLGVALFVVVFVVVGVVIGAEPEAAEQGLGLAMLRASVVSRGAAAASLGLGVVGLLAAMWAVVDPLAAAPAAAVFALIAFHVVAGWTMLRLGRGVEVSRARPRRPVSTG